MRRLAVLWIALAVAATGAYGLRHELERALASITAEDLRAHVYFLSHDLLRGRAPGTRGGEAAASYVASQMMRSGLSPVSGTHFQPVPLLRMSTAPEPSLSFEARGERIAARYPDDAVVWPSAGRTDVQLSGEIVFVGYGVDAPEYDWDDFKGRDLTGRILLILVNDPPAPPEDPDLFEGRAMTYYGRWTYKLEEARRRGAAGALLIHSSEAAGYEWNVVETSWAGTRFSLAPSSEAEPSLAMEGWITRDFAGEMLELAGINLDELYVRAARRDFRPVATGVLLRSRLRAETQRIETRNVVGMVPGTGPNADEYIVITSHYDHLGVGPPVDGDSIYNGAYDNASGVALLLEVAEAFTKLPRQPGRSVLFMATAAEESGLLGAEYYVRNPLVPLDATVASLNVDGANLWGPTDDVVVLGGDRSTLGRIAAQQAQELGLRLARDPAPDKGLFFRSDQFPFVQVGVPALHIQHGTEFRGRPPGWGLDTLGRYEARSYHRPSDEYDADFDFGGAVQQAQLTFLIAHAIASAGDRPAWVPGSRYRR